MIEPNDIDPYAAEYVLGTLSLEERREVVLLQSTNPAMRAAIAAWEKRLAPLNHLTPEATPSLDLWMKIQERLFKAPSSSPKLSWKAFALVASLLFICVIAVEYVPNVRHEPQLTATLQTDASHPMFVVSLNEKTSVLTVDTLTEAASPDKSYELWLIPQGEKTPKALGILPQKISQVSLKDMDRAPLELATLAVSLEPLGGSPTGAPTGPVIVTGKFEPRKL